MSLINASQNQMTADLYADFNGLNKLKYAAKNSDDQTLHEVTKQFEAIMIQSLLKSSRQANRIFESGLFSSEQTKFYEDFFDQQMSLSISGKGVGLASMLEDELKGNQRVSRSNTISNSAAKEIVTPEIDPLKKEIPEKEFNSPEDFVKKLWSIAADAAKKIEVDPKVLLAQAALETGWGKSIPKSPNGTSSHNLFGIKAEKNTTTPKVFVNTIEYIDGILTKGKAFFKSYSTIQDSFKDYVDLLKIPRYQDVIKNSKNIEEYIDALQKAGYATDPDYSKKIKEILKSHIFKELNN
jgi:flagellar protein FlgJ